ncbi:MAG: alpha/beta fold hydrolase [Anaerolineales bacterium]
MATYLFCVGGHTGGWWVREIGIESQLREAGHEVFRPTYTGVGERIHLSNPNIDLNTHIQDILMVLEYEELEDVILVGHSYGGMIAAGVAEKCPERIAHMVTLDGIIPNDGQSVADIIGAQVMEFLKGNAKAHGEGWQVIPDWPGVKPRHTGHPLATMQTKIDISNPKAAEIPKTYIFCTEGKEELPIIQYTIDQVPRVKSDPNWEYYEIQTDHELTETDELVGILLDIGRRSS